MSPFAVPSRLPGARSLATAALGVALFLPAVANAAPYEQISRDTGALGGSPLFGIQNVPAAVGDVGRYAGFERRRSNGDYGPTSSAGYVRDIQSNTTIDYGGGVRRIYGIDRAETRALIGRVRGGQFQIVAVPIAGGTPIIVASAVDTGADGPQPEAALSGDGRKVVYSFPQGGGTNRVDLTGGKVGKPDYLSYRYLRFGPHSLSDTASVVIGYDDNQGPTTHVFRLGNEFTLDTPAAVVDAKGTSLAWIAGYQDLAIRNLAAGTERRWNVATQVNEPEVLRLADNGTSAVITTSAYADTIGARTFTPGAGTAYTLTKFGSRYSTSLSGDFPATLLSANGRFGLTVNGNQVSIVDTTDTHIPGANDLYSAGAYVFGGSFVSICSEPAEFTAYLKLPSRFAPAAKKMTVLATGNGQTIASGTLTESVPADQSFLYGDYSDPSWSVKGTYDPNVVHAVKLKVSVTDANGKVQTETFTEVQPYC